MKSVLEAFYTIWKQNRLTHEVVYGIVIIAKITFLPGKSEINPSTLPLAKV